jgi:hypothetical protein
VNRKKTYELLWDPYFWRDASYVVLIDAMLAVYSLGSHLAWWQVGMRLSAVAGVSSMVSQYAFQGGEINYNRVLLDTAFIATISYGKITYLFTPMRLKLEHRVLEKAVLNLKHGGFTAEAEALLARKLLTDASKAGAAGVGAKITEGLTGLRYQQAVLGEAKTLVDIANAEVARKFLIYGMSVMLVNNLSGELPSIWIWKQVEPSDLERLIEEASKLPEGESVPVVQAAQALLEAQGTAAAQ